MEGICTQVIVWNVYSPLLFTEICSNANTDETKLILDSRQTGLGSFRKHLERRKFTGDDVAEIGFSTASVTWPLEAISLERVCKWWRSAIFLYFPLAFTTDLFGNLECIPRLFKIQQPEMYEQYQVSNVIAHPR